LIRVFSLDQRAKRRYLDVGPNSSVAADATAHGLSRVLIAGDLREDRSTGAMISGFLACDLFKEALQSKKYCTNERVRR